MEADNRSDVVASSPPRTRAESVKRKLKGALKANMIFSLTVHLAMLIIVGVNYKNCPLQPNIPPFFFVESALGVTSKLIHLCRNFIGFYVKVSRVLTLVLTVELVIFVIGSFYVFKTYEPDFDPASGDKYCDKTVYIFCLVYICVYYILMLIITVGFCYVMLEVIVTDKWVGNEDADVPVPERFEIQQIGNSYIVRRISL